MKLFLMILLNIFCPILGFLAGFYLAAAVTNSIFVPVSGFIGMSVGIVIPLYFQHKSWTGWELFKHSLKRIGFVCVCIFIGLIIGGIIADRIYNAAHPPIMPDLDEKGAPGDGLAGVVEVWLGALYGAIIGFMVGVVVPIIWEIVSSKLKSPRVVKFVG